ncbi:hypothetical protein BGZ46_002307 [Entomortierella lignicola]|nr:hypothetical protein BGZ46_002307 [Entomortierella lignicola]
MAGRKKTFWNATGMDTFIDWLADPKNHQRLTNPNTIDGKVPRTLYQEVATLVNDLHNTKWTHIAVKGKIQYIKKKIGEATDAINNMIERGDTDLDSRRKLLQTICPVYERFYALYGTSLRSVPLRNHPRPKRPIVAVYAFEDNNNDNNGYGVADLTPEPTVKEHQSNDEEFEEPNISGPERKRLRQNDHGTTLPINDYNNNMMLPDVEIPELELTTAASTSASRTTASASGTTVSTSGIPAPAAATTISKVVESNLKDIEEARRDLRQRERESYQRIAEKERKCQEMEREAYQRMAENEKKHQEMLDRRIQDFLQERAEFKAKQEQYELEYKTKVDKLEVKQEKFEAKKEKFESTRDQLLKENASMKRELEVRLTHINVRVNRTE